MRTLALQVSRDEHGLYKVACPRLGKPVWRRDPHRAVRAWYAEHAADLAQLTLDHRVLSVLVMHSTDCDLDEDCICLPG